jgi:sodium-dependent dicarboxylate transporter 2/3/5
VPLIALVVAGWVSLPVLTPLLPKDSLTDGTIAIAGALLLFVIPDGSGRALLNWEEANRAPWGVIMLFGGGLALAAGIGASGLDDWLGTALQPLRAVHPLVVALVLVALVILITEFASNVAAASGVIPVVAGIIAATGIDPILLALPAAWAASWGFMLPSGTGPNAIAWAHRAYRAAADAEGGPAARYRRRASDGRDCLDASGRSALGRTRTSRSSRWKTNPT